MRKSEEFIYMGHKSASYEQMTAEPVMIKALSEFLNIPLECIAHNKAIYFENTHVNVDFYSEAFGILGEVYAHVGQIKSAQWDKILRDVVKMLYIEEKLGKKYRKMIVVNNEALYNQLNGNSWKANVLDVFHIELHKINIDSGLEDSILKAQERQYR